MKLKKIFLPLTVFLFSATLALAEVTVVNPVPGNFSNTQTLVLESNGGEEIFYSFSGTDPFVSGFAYDGPVVLDVTGNVELRVVSVDSEQNRVEQKINYTVTPEEPQNAEHNAFLKSLETGPVFDYTAGNPLSIPFTMGYSFDGGQTFEKGREISVSKDSTVERYLPVVFSDSNYLWRFVLHLVPAQAGELSKRAVPFKVQDWTKIVFTDPKSIYSLDGSWWQSASEPVVVDRSEENAVFFQSAEYSDQNPVTRVVLPPKPSLLVERRFDGSLKISVKPDPLGGQKNLYKLSSSSFSKARLVSQGLYSDLVIDTFPGDKIESHLSVDVYYDAVYQGTLLADVDLNRSTPNIPRIVASAQGSYSREDVTVRAEGSKKLRLFVSVPDPVEIKPSFTMPDLSSIKFSHSEYLPYGGEKIHFYADTEKILAYKVSFYSEDIDGLKSATAEYSVIIDKYNYYVDSSSTSPEQNGSPFAPFKDLSRLSKIVNKNSFTRFYIRGDAALAPGEASLTTNVEFSGTEDARILVPSNSVIVLKNSGLFAENIVFEKTEEAMLSKKPRAAAKALTSLFILDHSAATFKNCEVIANFGGDGTVFNLASSALSVSDSGITGKAGSYSSVLSAAASKVDIKASRVLCIGSTAVNFSANGTAILLDNVFCQVTATVGRLAEFIDSRVSLTNNKFSAEVTPRTDSYKMIYSSGKTVFTQNEGNIFK